MIEFAHILIAAVLGAMIGIERELAGKPAGLRTHIFVATASALLVILVPDAINIIKQEFPERAADSDPIRVIQAIIVGISFLGAGTIVHHHGDQVEGLTTAGSIYLTAGIGIAVAVHRIWLAAAVTVLALVVLIVFDRIEERIKHRLGRKTDQDDDE